MAMDFSILLLSLFFCIFAAALLRWKVLSPTSHSRSPPPGPPTIVILTKFLWGRRSMFDIQPILRQLHARYGPVITLRITSPPTVFISDRRLAHQALIQNGAACADRPVAVEPDVFLTSNQHDISSSGYGPLWRLLRRNLASETLHPSRVKLFAPAREWALRLLTDKLQESSAGNGIAVPVTGIQYSMYCLLILMCFGVMPEEKVVKETEAAQRFLLLYFTKFNVFEHFPSVTKFLFRRRWNEILAARMELHEIFLGFSRERQERKKEGRSSLAYAYVDSLLELELPEEGGRRLTDDEIVTLCSEFLAAGTDTTTTALHWIMANLVKHQDVQRRLVEEIESVVGREVVGEEDLQRMPYLKAVVMEGLRRHPPGHYLLPHAVSEDVTVGGYVIPKGTSLNLEVAEMNWDGEAWEEPAEFRPERFLVGGEGEGMDITGSREIRMMSFGAGRRICPGLGLAMLHLEYFVANMVRMFEWKAIEGEEVDMSENLEFTVGMKKPLRSRIIPRWI